MSHLFRAAESPGSGLNPQVVVVAVSHWNRQLPELSDRQTVSADQEPLLAAATGRP